ncbi:hypothetical protein CCYA_CCYA02G0470 [Cyanidiococcus yangmingshanensis]|nr:hypothetical protein CCYA_CCYA02G0470 [Cyanidiococcus yangmingshanensis]
MKEGLRGSGRCSPVGAGTPHALVLVLGRLEQSPRMLAHATALAEVGCRVTLAGYGSVDEHHPSIQVVSLSSKAPASVHVATSTRRCAARVLYLVLVLSALWGRFRQALRVLEQLPPWDLLIIQNPPAFPTFFLTLWLRWRRIRRKALIVIDWHNTTHSIMAVNEAPGLAIAVARRLEYFLGKRIADAHLSVTRMLRSCLLFEMHLDPERVLVLPDRPLRAWIDRQQRHLADEGVRLALRRAWCTRVLGCSDAALERMVTEPWLCSSTSWTPDEPMELLFQAMAVLEREHGWSGHLFITGRGPLQSHYVETIWPKLGLHRWHLHALWLPSRADYAELLSIANVGISMHMSSSGMDLPMKVFDMWGCGIPVVAYSYPCLEQELPLSRLSTEAQATKAPPEDVMGACFTDLSGLVRAIQLVKEHEERYRANIARTCSADPTWQWESQYERRFLPFWRMLQTSAPPESISAVRSAKSRPVNEALHNDPHQHGE